MLVDPGVYLSNCCTPKAVSKLVSTWRIQWNTVAPFFHVALHYNWTFQETSNRTHVSRTPKKPEYLITRSQLTERGPLGFGPIQMFDGNLTMFFSFPPPNVDGSEIRRSPPGMVLKPVVNNGISTTNLNWWVDPRISGCHQPYVALLTQPSWTLKKKFERLIFPTKYVIPKSLKFSLAIGQVHSLKLT